MEGGRTPGTFSWLTLEGGLAGNIPRQAPDVEERDERIVVGRAQKSGGQEEEQYKAASGNVVGGRADSAKGNSAKYKRCGKRENEPVHCLVRSAAYVVVKAIRQRSAPTSSLF